MIDLHTHITDAVFDADREGVLQQAWDAGLTAVVAVGQTIAENEAVLQLANQSAANQSAANQSAAKHTPALQQPVVLPFLGWHPDQYADKKSLPSPAEEDAVEAQIKAHAEHICGIGEVGLDRWVCQKEANRERQMQMFKRLINLGLALDLPLNVHSRSAGERTLALLIQQGATRVLMHAYDGKASKAMVGVEAGYVFSIPPSIVRSPQKQKLVRHLPLEALALETDSPVLGPTQETRNVPANAITVSLQAIAGIKALPVEKVAQILLQNSQRLLGAQLGSLH